MGHVIEAASSGRAKCRGCGDKIAKGQLRLGERLPNAYGDGEMTLWFHVVCGAYCRPETMRSTLEETSQAPDDAAQLRHTCELGIEHHRLQRIQGVQRSPSGRARCRSCKEPIKKDEWRIKLQFFEEDRFNPAGYLHVVCSRDYFGTTEIIDRLAHFGSTLDTQDISTLEAELAKPSPAPADG